MTDSAPDAITTALHPLNPEEGNVTLTYPEAVAMAATAIYVDPKALRFLAAWALGRALYVEQMKAERKRARILAAEFARSKRIEFGVEDEKRPRLEEIRVVREA